MNNFWCTSAIAPPDLRNQFATVPLLVARDPLGIKPLYYAQTPEGFCCPRSCARFSEQVAVPRKLSLDALTSYLLFGERLGTGHDESNNFLGFSAGHPRLLLHLPDRRRTPRPRPWRGSQEIPGSTGPANRCEISSGLAKIAEASGSICPCIFSPTFPSERPLEWSLFERNSAHCRSARSKMYTKFHTRVSRHCFRRKLRWLDGCRAHGYFPQGKFHSGGAEMLLLVAPKRSRLSTNLRWTASILTLFPGCSPGRP